MRRAEILHPIVKLPDTWPVETRHHYDAREPCFACSRWSGCVRPRPSLLIKQVVSAEDLHNYENSPDGPNIPMALVWQMRYALGVRGATAPHKLTLSYGLGEFEMDGAVLVAEAPLDIDSVGYDADGAPCAEWPL